ncbi:signal transduction histidine kinase [Sphingomonas jejuensis]|uniref:histidine kinase n=1 Tax=Sphingomonas jejuensis TaxID=904715 RepID=A0ABX0XIU7_9SPHN|nr:ATP-binding protein [Sphingomonas jejuensis]NJC32769.1 signal transduction histidine kinase [Sphingomonas jejuensis]
MLVAVALLAAQAINFVLLLRASEQQRFYQTTGPPIAQLIEAMRMDALGLMAGDQRRPMLGRTFETTQSPVTSGMSRRRDVESRARALLSEAGLTVPRLIAAEVPAQEMRVQLDPLSSRRRTDILAREVLLISVELQPGRWLSAIAVIPSPDYGVVAWLLFQTLVLYGVVLVPVLWIGGRMGRPLGELRAAANSFRSTAPAVPVAERGPEDIRGLIGAFNAMRTRIAGMLDEKDRMLGAIGHDLRTPLASLRVRAEFVDDETERDRMARTIDDMNRTLDDILSLARLGRPSEAPSRVDLPALIETVLADFIDLGADVAFEPGPRIVASVRANLVARAVRNMVENAVKYGGSARVRVRTDLDQLVVEVDDDGPGIPNHQIAHMFEPFTRLDSSRNREKGGVGLGLALANAIARLHDGEMTLRNREGGGLRASMRLPREAEPVPTGPERVLT